MARSIKDLERLEKDLKERAESADALDRVRDAKRVLYPKEQSSHPIHRSTRGQWESQSKGGLSLPRRRR